MKEMDKWINIFKDMITLGLFLLTGYAAFFKLIDAWEKRKTVQYKDLQKELSDRIDKNDLRISKVENCCSRIESENVEIRSKAKDTWELILKWFEK